MPTQSTTYNSRVTDESLEKRFRDTFRSQGGAELVDDLYAQGVIVPIVDFTNAATGDVLAENLQTAYDFTTGHDLVSNTTTNIISTPGFWQINANVTSTSESVSYRATIAITDGFTSKTIWQFNTLTEAVAGFTVGVQFGQPLIVFVRAGDTVTAQTNVSLTRLNVSYRQIADVNGTVVNPLGFSF